MNETEEHLLQENNELRLRLSETEILLKTLQQCEAKSTFNSPNKAENAMTFTQWETPYNTIIEEMNQGVCTISDQDIIMYCNPMFSEFLYIPLQQMMGSNITKILSDKESNFRALLTQARQVGKSQQQITFNRNPKELKFFLVSVSSIPSGKQGELFILITDITEIKQVNLANEELLISTRFAALNIMEDEIEAKNALARSNRKLIEEIRERKKAACALHQSQHDLLQAQQMAHIGNWSYDCFSNDFKWSEEIFSIFGFDPKYPVPATKEIRNLIHPDDRQYANEIFKTLSEHGVKKELELRIRNAKQIDRTIFIICNPQLNSEGKTIKLNGIIQDISERKQAEKELIKVNRLYNIISQINQMIVRNKNRENIFSEACNIAIDHGKFRMAWIGLIEEKDKSLKPVTWAGHEDGYLTKIKTITATNTPQGLGPTGTAIRKGEYYYCNDIAKDPNMEIWRKDALERNYHSSIALPISVFGKIIGALTIYVSEPHFFNQSEIDLLLQVTSDISFALEVIETEMKRVKAEKSIRKLNKELEQRVKFRTIQLEYINKELEAFTYSVSHDLRSPLRNINGWSQILRDECKEELGAKGCQYIDRVLIESKRMNNLIDDLMELSKVTQVEIKRERVNLTTLAQNITHRLQDTHPNHQLELIIQPGLETVGDPQMLDIALTNLFDNAYKFTGKLPLARIEFGKSEIKGKPTYWICDNGVGFDMAQSKNLFGAFQRMHKQNDFPGTGIGLATVQRIIHRHDGHIWAESQIDHGTTFYFTIPEEII